MESEATACDKGHVVDLSEWHCRHVYLLICKDAYRRSLRLTLCVTAADGWAGMCLAKIFCLWEGRGTNCHKRWKDLHIDTLLTQTLVVRTFCCLRLYCCLPLKLKCTPIVLWNPISCWCSCCWRCCSHESWYSARVVVLILLHQRSTWIMMASNCKAVPRASLLTIMRWRYDWLVSYFKEKQPYFQNDTDIFFILMDF